MWWLLAFGSAALLGGYDSFKKISLKDNAIVPVLCLNTIFCAVIFSPWLFETGFYGWGVQIFVIGKSVLVSFAIGALILKEKNLKAKALDLGLLLLSMLLLYLGSK